MEKVNFFRKKYPRFVYQSYSYKISGRNLEIFFDFSIESNIKFRPKITVKNIDKKRLREIEDKTLNNLIFHLGLIEIPSYWKATCSPIIEIKAGSLNKEQIKWWKNLIMRGMGQFFYENKIDFQKPNFLKIKNQNQTILANSTMAVLTSIDTDKVLVPIGGGKDSIVTLELLKKRGRKINCFSVNPSRITQEVMKIAAIKKPIIIKREIDPFLLELNKKGYLNGHTPITAVLSFLSVFGAVLFNYKNIAFSNEKSADEGNVKYLGKMINHQWSKSSEFEEKFRYYSKKYLAKEINYFSYLRKYTELEIAKMFTKYPKYFSVFSSCNVVLAKKMKRRWCGNCPKCLFLYLTLYPFLEKKQLLEIFGADIFENKKLLPLMKALIGQGIAKPFECVGTKKESRIAFELSLKKAEQEGKVPNLLTKIK